MGVGGNSPTPHNLLVLDAANLHAIRHNGLTKDLLRENYPERDWHRGASKDVTGCAGSYGVGP